MTRRDRALLAPIFQEQGRRYQADTCAALIRGVAAGEVRLDALVRGHYPGRPLARGALPGVNSVGFWDAEHDQPWGLDWHRNEGLEVTFLERGQLGFAVGDFEGRLKPDDLTITRPWQPHRVGDPCVGAGRLHWLILDVGVRRPHQRWRWPDWLVLSRSDSRELTDALRQNEQAVWHATAEIRQCFRRIAQAVEADRHGSSVSRLAVYLNELFVLMLDMFRGSPVALDESLSNSQRTVDLFWNDLRENEATLAMEWTVTRMARECGLGVTHFTHCTRQLTNVTPAQHLARCRLETAARLLKRHPEWSVVQVARACGFSSSQYFATLFGRQFGCTPRAWRERP
jgi:AraC-like DNA-binding protein